MGKDYWPRTDVCCRYLVRVNVGLVYLDMYQHQLMMLIHPVKVAGGACLVATQVYGRRPRWHRCS